MFFVYIVFPYRLSCHWRIFNKKFKHTYLYRFFSKPEWMMRQITRDAKSKEHQKPKRFTEIIID
jgi:hypothetical protein